jgi:choline dehydrogenase-like flavoprotein
METTHYDIIIIGSGAGGGTLAHALAGTGKNILIIERGDFLKRSKNNWDPVKVFRERIYCTPETWYTEDGRSFRPKQHYCVGGSTKFFGGVLVRFRESDFGKILFPDGASPAWPVTYDAIEPYYSRAEHLYNVHGIHGEDITGPPASSSYPHPPVLHEPVVEDLVRSFVLQGLHPAHIPVAVDIGNRPGKEDACIRCNTCDGFPCLANGKFDTELCCIKPALKHNNVSIVTNTTVERLVTDPSGREIRSVEAGTNNGEKISYKGSMVILCAGAINSSVILLRSRSDRYPAGLANSSGMLGKNLMFHNASAVLAINPFSHFEKTFLKTMVLNDYYLADGNDAKFPYPMGNIQLLGNVTAAMMKATNPVVPGTVTRYLDKHSLPFYLSTEDVPVPENRIELTADNRIRICYRKTNTGSHVRLFKRLKEILRPSGFRWFIQRKAGFETLGHQCGTTRFGNDPSQSVLNPFCKAHDLDNLYVVDTGFFPSSSALNPALTVMAFALRVSDHLKERMK